MISIYYYKLLYLLPLYLVSQSCLTLCDPIDCSPPGLSVHGDSPVKNTGVGYTMPSSRRSSQPMYWTQVSCIAGGYFTLELKWSPFILYPLVNIFLQVYQQLNWHLFDIVRSQITKDQFSTGQILVVLEKTFESPLDCKEIQPVNPKGNQFWIFIGRTDAEAETPALWPPDAKSWLIWKDPDSLEKTHWEIFRAEGEGKTEEGMVGWHQQLNGHEFE